MLSKTPIIVMLIMITAQSPTTMTVGMVMAAMAAAAVIAPGASTLVLTARAV